MLKDKHPETRLITLRNLLEQTQAQFAQDIGITQSALSQIENRNRKLSTDILMRITRKFKVNADWILHGTGTAFKTQRVAATPKGIDPPKETLIPLVDKEAHADYPTNFQDDEYISQFSVYRIPGYEEGNYRMFEVVGNSMEPTLFENEFIITELVENTKSIGNGRVYVLITEQGIVVKRVFVYKDGYDAWILKSDNPEYKSYKLLPGELYEAWEVKGKITSKFLTAKTEKVSRISELEERMEKMEKLFAKLLDK